MTTQANGVTHFSIGTRFRNMSNGDEFVLTDVHTFVNPEKIGFNCLSEMLFHFTQFEYLGDEIFENPELVEVTEDKAVFTLMDVLRFTSTGQWKVI